MSTTTSSPSASGSSKALVVDPFCFRQFSEFEQSQSYGGTVFSKSVAEFEEIVNSRYDESLLKDGYAPFCKHLFVANDFTDAKVNVLSITSENESCLRSSYEARNDLELPILQRSFSLPLLQKQNPSFVLPTAKYLDLILYSREQINKENESMGKPKETNTDTTAPWGIVSIKAQDVDYELPMTPITAMRNALGKEHGGSGVALNREEYMKAVEFWSQHANIS